MTITPSERLDLSWQQFGRLRRDEERGEHVPNCNLSFLLPEDMSDARFDAGLAAVVSREYALRTTEISLADGGYSVSAARVDPTTEKFAVNSESEVSDIFAEMRHRLFPRGGADRLWDIAIITYPGADGRPIRRVCGTFDHLISDARSTWSLREELLRPDPALTFRHGKHPDWVAEQRRRYPMDASATKTPAAEFWLDFLDGVDLEAPSADFPFCAEPAGELSGFVRCLRRALPAAVTWRAAARRYRTTPFLLFLASTASSVGSTTGIDDLTLRINTAGRELDYFDTQGYFAENTPIRIRDRALADGDTRGVLEAAQRAWIRTLRFQSTPWDYILAIHDKYDTAALVARPAQVLINFVPWSGPPRPASLRDRDFAGLVGTLQFIVRMTDDGACDVECQFDPGRFATDGVETLLDILTARVTDLTTPP
ncbi:hypothetical protein ACWEKT_27335 [Nocardia takedensis]